MYKTILGKNGFAGGAKDAFTFSSYTKTVVLTYT